MRQIEKIFRNAALKLYRGFIAEKDINPSEIVPSQVKTILFVIRHRMGDMLCALPAMQSLKKVFPGVKLIVVTMESTRFSEVFTEENSPADEVYYFENGFENFIDLVKQLQLKDIDIAVVPSTVVFSGTNHFIAYYSRPGVIAGVRSLDFDKNPAWYLLNLKNDFEWGLKKIHQVERNLDIIRQLKINPGVTKINISLSIENKKYAENFLDANFPDRSKKIIGFHPGAGKESNVWPAEKFAELASALYHDFNAYIFISEGPGDEKYAGKMKNLLFGKYSCADIAVHKGRLMNNSAIIEKLDLFITNDTGVMHIASGLITPLIALFGGTNAYEWGPLGENKCSLQAQDGNINSISVENVYKLCKNIIGKTTV